MKPMKTKMLATTVIPIALAAGFTLVSVNAAPDAQAAQSVAQNRCNPCAAKKVGNPCAAKRPGNPCAAQKGCNPCNPCAAASYNSKCIVPRLASANPCAAKKACSPCAPKRACNPCAAKKGGNPCAAKNPCGAAAEVKLSKAEAVALYDCLKGEMKASYAKSGNLWAKSYSQWARFSTQPYAAATHGNRFVHNYASRKAAASYGKFEKGGRMAPGGVLAKDSFTVTPQGRVSVGPLFLMEKMQPGFLKASNDWRYTMIMPDGQTAGTTKGKGSKTVQFCIACHQAVADEQDAMFFLPEEFRIK